MTCGSDTRSDVSDEWPLRPRRRCLAAPEELAISADELQIEPAPGHTRSHTTTLSHQLLDDDPSFVARDEPT